MKSCKNKTTKHQNARSIDEKLKTKSLMFIVSFFFIRFTRFQILKFKYSEKATKCCEISTVDLSYIVPVKSTVEISQNIWTLICEPQSIWRKLLVLSWLYKIIRFTVWFPFPLLFVCWMFKKFKLFSDKPKVTYFACICNENKGILLNKSKELTYLLVLDDIGE